MKSDGTTSSDEDAVNTSKKLLKSGEKDELEIGDRFALLPPLNYVFVVEAHNEHVPSEEADFNPKKEEVTEGKTEENKKMEVKEKGEDDDTVKMNYRESDEESWESYAKSKSKKRTASERSDDSLTNSESEDFPKKKKVNNKDVYLSDDSGDESKPFCKFGPSCYRKNPEHKRQFRHDFENQTSPGFILKLICKMY